MFYVYTRAIVSVHGHYCSPILGFRADSLEKAAQAFTIFAEGYYAACGFKIVAETITDNCGIRDSERYAEIPRHLENLALFIKRFRDKR